MSSVPHPCCFFSLLLDFSHSCTSTILNSCILFSNWVIFNIIVICRRYTCHCFSGGNQFEEMFHTSDLKPTYGAVNWLISLFMPWWLFLFLIQKQWFNDGIHISWLIANHNKLFGEIHRGNAWKPTEVECGMFLWCNDRKYMPFAGMVIFGNKSHTNVHVSWFFVSNSNFTYINIFQQKCKE